MYPNKVNNMKKNDEFKFKKEKVESNLGDTASLWIIVKGFMDWKAAGTPSHIMFENVL